MKHLLSIVCILAASTGVLLAEVTKPKERRIFSSLVDDLNPNSLRC